MAKQNNSAKIASFGKKRSGKAKKRVGPKERKTKPYRQQGR